MDESKIIYKHCRNCKYCAGKMISGTEIEHFCSVKHTDCDFLGRLKALICRFFATK